MQILRAQVFHSLRFRLDFKSKLIVAYALTSFILFSKNQNLYASDPLECLAQIRSLASDLEYSSTNPQNLRYDLKQLREHFFSSTLKKSLLEMSATTHHTAVAGLVDQLARHLYKTDPRSFWSFFLESQNAAYFPQMWFAPQQIQFWETLIKDADWQPQETQLAFQVFTKAITEYKIRADQKTELPLKDIQLRTAWRYARLGSDLSRLHTSRSPITTRFNALRTDIERERSDLRVAWTANAKDPQEVNFLLSRLSGMEEVKDILNKIKPIESSKSPNPPARIELQESKSVRSLLIQASPKVQNDDEEAPF
jgi:hypothetical protein